MLFWIKRLFCGCKKENNIIHYRINYLVKDDFSNEYCWYCYAKDKEIATEKFWNKHRLNKFFIISIEQCKK